MADDPDVQAIEKTHPHLKIYPIAIKEERRLPSAPADVVLVDQFDDRADIRPTYRVGTLSKFATPTQKFPFSQPGAPVREAPPRAPHYTWYPITEGPEGHEPAQAPAFRVYAKNQFRFEFFDICGAHALLVPAAKTHRGNDYPVPAKATHFKVYKIDVGPRNEGAYWLRDQFTLSWNRGHGVGHAVKSPVFFATPCDKNAEPRSGPAHLLIYELDPESAHYRPAELVAGDQFGKYRLGVETPEYLAVPTLKDRFSRLS